VQQRNPRLEVDICGTDGTRIVVEMIPHQFAAGCLAGCNDGLRVVDHFDATVDISLPSGPALAKLQLCALLATPRLNHVNKYQTRTGGRESSGHDPSDHQQGR
jgi:hypothetical protein